MSGISWKGRIRAAAGLALAVTVFQCGSASAASGSWTWPVEGRVITPYLNDDARPYAGGMHRGIDIAAPVGTAVVAAQGGRVSYAGSLGSSGLTVAIATADGSYETSYLHLDRIDVKRGDQPGTGAKLGEVGVTGTRSASEPHLHFGIRLAGTEHAYLDPLTLLPPLPGEQRGASGAPAPRSAPLEARPELVPASAPQSRRLPARLPILHGLPGTQPVPVPAHVAPKRAAAASARTGAPAPALARAARTKAFGHVEEQVPLAPRAALRLPGPVAALAPRAKAGYPGPHPAGGGWGRWLALGGAFLIAAVLARRGLGLVALELARRLQPRRRRERPQKRSRAAGREPPPLGVVSQVG